MFGQELTGLIESATRDSDLRVTSVREKRALLARERSACVHVPKSELSAHMILQRV